MHKHDIVCLPNGSLGHVLKVGGTLVLVAVPEDGERGIPLPKDVHPDTQARIFKHNQLEVLGSVVIKPSPSPRARWELVVLREEIPALRPGVWRGAWVYEGAGYTGRDFFCADCDERDLSAKSYMVQDALWRKHVPENGVVCAPCFEKRLGRRLLEADLKDCILSAEYLVLRDLSPNALKAWQGEAVRAYQRGADVVSALRRLRADYAPFAQLNRAKIDKAVEAYTTTLQGAEEVLEAGGVQRRVFEWADYLVPLTPVQSALKTFFGPYWRVWKDAPPNAEEKRIWAYRVLVQEHAADDEHHLSIYLYRSGLAARMGLPQDAGANYRMPYKTLSLAEMVVLLDHYAEGWRDRVEAQEPV